MSFRRLPILFLLPLLQLGACSDPAGSGDPGVGPDGPGGPDGPNAPAADGGEAGVGYPPDEDTDDGPLWNGKLSSTPKFLAKDVYQFVVTEDEQLVYTTENEILAMPATGGTASRIGNAAWASVFRAGRAAIVAAEGGADSLGWSKAAGARTLTGLSLERSDDVIRVSSASGDVVLVAKPQSTQGQLWLLEPSTLKVTPVTAPSAGILETCMPRGEGFLCSARVDDRTELWSIEASTAKVLIGIEARPSGAASLIDGGGDVVFVRTIEGTHRVAVGSNESPKKLADGAQAVLLQGGWLAVTSAPPAREVKVMRMDGSSVRSIASPAVIAGGVENSPSSRTSRYRWLPVCDVDANNKTSNLRFVEPATGTTVPASSSCRLMTMTYSDNYALLFDNWVETPGSSVTEGHGDLVLFDIRDGRKTPNPFVGGASAAGPLGKSRLFATQGFPPAEGRMMWFHDAHSPPGTEAARLPNPLGDVYRWEFTSAGIVGATKPPNDAVGELSYLAW